MAALSLVTLAVAGGLIWIAASLPVQRAPKLEPPEFLANVEAATSLEALKTICRSIAGSYDVQSAHIAFLNRAADQIV